jgi:hypothetical protein
MNEFIAVAAVVIVAWFAAGTIWNIRAGRALMRWMQDGLAVLGSRTTVRWLGSTVAELVIADARPPFTRVTLVIFLEPRDLPWWPLSRALGRRDTFIIRGATRRAPQHEFEALDPASWSGRNARVPREWTAREGAIVVYYENPAALARADALIERARNAGLQIRRLSVRRAETAIQLHLPLPERQRQAREFFEAIHDLSELALT